MRDVAGFFRLATGIALLTVVSPWVRDQESWLTVILGGLGTLGVFLCAYWLEGRLEEDQL